MAYRNRLPDTVRECARDIHVALAGAETGEIPCRASQVDVKVQTSNESVESLKDIYDIVIRGGPDTFYGYSMRPFLSEERVPVCSPALLQRVPLRMPEDMRQHTLLHTSSLPRLWPDWLAKAQIPALRPAAALTFDHFYRDAFLPVAPCATGTDRPGRG